MDKSLKKGQILQGSPCMSYVDHEFRGKRQNYGLLGQCGLRVSRRSRRGKRLSDC